MLRRPADGAAVFTAAAAYRQLDELPHRGAGEPENNAPKEMTCQGISDRGCVISLGAALTMVCSLVAHHAHPKRRHNRRSRQRLHHLFDAAPVVHRDPGRAVQPLRAGRLKEMFMQVD